MGHGKVRAVGHGRERRLLRASLCHGVLGVVGIAALAGEASAGEFSLGNGIEGRWGLDMSVAAAMRTEAPDPNLVSVGNGGNADGSTIDDGNLNYQRGDLYSLVGKVIGEVKLEKDDIGFFGRGKAWYDYIGNNKAVSHGHSANGHANGRLQDTDFQPKSQFDGVELLDAYVYGNWDFANGQWLSVKAGNHVVNWGEGLFTSGISSYNVIDAATARRPGAQVKEIISPVPQVSAAFGLTESISLEGFYQVAWKPTVIEGCGTFWGPSDSLNCSKSAALFAPTGFSDQQAAQGMAALGGLNGWMNNAGTEKPKDQGQFGVAARYYDFDLATDFGLYYVQYHQRAPSFSLKRQASTVPGSLYGVRPVQYFTDYSAENIRVYGASASTAIGGWSVMGEYSFHNDVPVQINASDLVNGVANGTGPLAALAGLPLGSTVRGYDRKDKHQLQVATIKSFPSVLGAESLSVMGEAAYQHWSGIGDPYTSVRYGRSSGFGRAASAGSACGTSMANYCAADGYATPDAWGLRARLALNYQDVIAGVNLSPAVFVKWDVDGISADGTFQEGQKAVSLSLAADLDKVYYANLSYSRYANNAKYDDKRDRDTLSLVVGMTF